ncbi:MAG TPA: glycosyltransferase [Terriglobales bacterium]|nr:glycosyltransferase [Terriglobales bacterium]
MLFLAILVLLIWIHLWFFHGQFWRVNDLHLPVAEPISHSRVAAVIPARNEADVIRRAIGSLLRQQFAGDLRLVVVDDNSNDGTANVARAAAGVLGDAHRLTVIAGSQLPAGWTGKVWAMHQGWQVVRQMNPDYLLLTDADIEHAPDNLARLVAQAERGKLDLVSLMVKLRCERIAEKFLIPAFVYLFFLLYPPKRISASSSRVAGAAGGCILLRPEALEKGGGFESIRGEIIDDCALAARVKAPGGRLWLGVTQQTRSMRGYQTIGNICDMIARTAFNQLRHSWLLLIGCIAGMLFTFVTPVALVFSANRPIGWIALTSCILMFSTYVPTLRLYRVNLLSAVTLPFSAMFYIYATVVSAIKYCRGHGGEWKDRTQDAPEV